MFGTEVKLSLGTPSAHIGVPWFEFGIRFPFQLDANENPEAADDNSSIWVPDLYKRDRH